MRLILCIVTLLVISGSSAGAVPRPPYTELTFEQASEIAIRFDRISDMIPIETYGVVETEEDAEEWAEEIVPFFGYEGVTDPDRESGRYGSHTFPDNIDFDYYDSAQSHGHSMGSANCFNNDVNMSGRFANQHSALRVRISSLAVFVHELGHVQGICFSKDAETSTELVTLEMLAALSNYQNQKAFGPLMETISDISYKAAWWAAVRDGKDIDVLQRTLADNAVEYAGYKKHQRYVDADPDLRKRILYQYNYAVLVRVLQALRSETCSSYEYYAADEDTVAQRIVTIPYPCIHGINLPINMLVFDYPLVIDDLAYVWEHAEEMAEVYAKE